MEKPTETPAAKIARYDMDYQCCIICQLDTDQALVAAPTSHKKSVEHATQSESVLIMVMETFQILTDGLVM